MHFSFGCYHTMLQLLQKPALIFLIALLPGLATAQKQGYLKTKEMLYYGAIHGLETPDPTQVVFQFNNGNKKAFKPGEALEFAIEDGQKKWVARTVQGTTLFYELLEHGRVSLLSLRDGKQRTYFLERDSTLTLLSAAKTDQAYYKEVLETELEDCYLTAKSINLAKYKRANLKYFVSQYNDCLHKPFPKFRIGPAVGLKMLNNEIKSKYFPAVPETDMALSLGGIIEIPVSYKPQFLIALQPSAAHFTFTTEASTYNPETGITSLNTHYLDHIDLDLPVLLKYRLPFYYASPYLQAGFAAQVGLSTKSYSLTDRLESVNGQLVVTEEDIYVDSGALASSFFGTILGAGVEIPLTPYITSIVGFNYSMFKADVETGYNKKRSADFFIAFTF